MAGCPLRWSGPAWRASLAPFLVFVLLPSPPPREAVLAPGPRHVHLVASSLRIQGVCVGPGRLCEAACDWRPDWSDAVL
eukprot:7574773-Pyramimonas_sp.AAC.1